jgi:hypothetical protein
MPFKNVAEMVATLTAVYHDDNQGTKAREELRNLKYNPRDKTIDIHQFIGRVNSLADKANIAKADYKTVLFEHIPANLNPQLLGDSKDPLISYETFANKVADSALSQARAWEERQEYRKKRQVQKDIHPENKQGKKNFNKTPEDKGPSREELKKDGKCFLCQKEGHIARKCPGKLKRP